MSYTTLQLLKIIPLDETLRSELLSSYESMEPARQYEISVATTDAFDEYRTYLENIFLDHVLEMQASTGKISNDAVRQAKTMTVEYVGQLISGIFARIAEDTVKLNALRAQVTQLMQR